MSKKTEVKETKAKCSVTKCVVVSLIVSGIVAIGTVLYAGKAQKDREELVKNRAVNCKRIAESVASNLEAEHEFIDNYTHNYKEYGPGCLITIPRIHYDSGRIFYDMAAKEDMSDVANIVANTTYEHRISIRDNEYSENRKRSIEESKKE